MKPIDVQKMIQRKRLEENLRNEFEATIDDRVTRYLEVKPHEIIPHTHFSQVSTEISALFRDGQFYGCIALSQAVGEALVRFMCLRNKCKTAKKFEVNLSKLHKRGFLSDEAIDRLSELWTGRDNYHHLNPSIEQDRDKLRDLAKRKAILLMEVEKEVFEFSGNDGKLDLKNPKYWDENDQNQLSVYLRFEP